MHPQHPLAFAAFLLEESRCVNTNRSCSSFSDFTQNVLTCYHLWSKDFKSPNRPQCVSSSRAKFQLLQGIGPLPFQPPLSLFCFQKRVGRQQGQVVLLPVPLNQGGRAGTHGRVALCSRPFPWDHSKGPGLSPGYQGG